MTIRYRQYNDHGPEVVAGATSSAPKVVYYVGRDATITAFPTAAGTATVYFSTSKQSDCEADVAANNFSSGSAKWQAWTAGAVSALTSAQAYSNVTAIAVVPASGTWTLEVCR